MTIKVPAAIDVVVTDDTLRVDLSDGRSISVPIGCTRALRMVRRKSSRRGV